MKFLFFHPTSESAPGKGSFQIMYRQITSIASAMFFLFIKGRRLGIALLFSLVFAGGGLFAQSPDLINYQGAARLQDGTPLDNRSISVKFDIRQGSSSGAIVASETQTLQTNSLGLFSTQIGKTTSLSGINWAGTTVFLQVSIDTSAGSNFSSLGTQQMVSVPYALHASSVPASYANNVLTIGSTTLSVSPTIAVTPNTSLTLSGIGTVTSAGTNTFDINIQAPVITGQNAATVTGAYPNYTVNAATPSLAVTTNSAAAASVNSSGSSFSINIPPPDFTNSGQNIITGTYPNFTVNTPTVPAAITPSIVLSTTAAAGASVSSTGSSFSLNVPPPVFTNSGQNIISGTYPNFTVNTPTVPAAITPSIAVTTTAAAGASVSSTGSSFSINIPPPAFTNTGQNIITGTYPNFSVNTPTVGATPLTTISPSGLVSVTNPATNSFVVGVQAPVFTNSGQSIITGTYPNFTVNTPTVPAAITPSIEITTTAAAGASVTSSGSSFSINVPPPAFTNTGQNIISGTYPNFSVNTPTVPGTSIALSSTAAAGPSVSVIGTNSFNINIPPSDAWSLGGSAGTSTTTNFIGTTDANNLHIKTNNTLAVAVSTLGYVGVGTPNPSTMIDIANSGTAAGGLNISMSNASNNNTGIQAVHVGGGSGSNAAYFQVNNSVSNGHALITTSNSDNQHTVRSLNTGTSLSSYAGMFEGGLIGRGKNNPSSFALKGMDFSGVDLFVVRSDGNVGIGTNAPAATLHVNGTTRLVDGTQGAGRVLTSDALGNASWQVPAAGWGLTGNAGTNSSNYIGTTDNQSVTFKTNNTQAAVLNTSGYFGIGSLGSAATAHLQVDGSEAGTILNGFSASPGTALRLHNNDLTNNNFSSFIFSSQASNAANFEAAKIVGQTTNHSTGSLSGELVFLTRNPTNINEVMRIRSTGEVGIGTSAPSGNLHVNSQGSYVLTRISSLGATTGLVTYIDGASASIMNYENSPLYLGTNGMNRVVLSNTGAFGIGNSSPAATLHVTGTTRLADGTQGPGKVLTSDALGNATWQTPATGWGLTGSAGTNPATNFVGTTDNQDLVFRTNNTEIFRTQPTGGLRFATGMNHTISVQSPPGSAGGNSLLIKAANATGGGSAQNGGDLILQGGDEYNQTFTPYTAGNVYIRSGKNLTSATAPTKNGGAVIFHSVDAGNNYFESGRFDIDGNFVITGTASKPGGGSWAATSDARLKTNVHPYEGGLTDILKIQPVWYTYTGEANLPKETYVGVIAQELQKITPYMVKEWTYKRNAEDPGTNYLSVDNGPMMYMMINAIKEQQKQIEELKKQVEELRKSK